MAVKKQIPVIDTKSKSAVAAEVIAQKLQSVLLDPTTHNPKTKQNALDVQIGGDHYKSMGNYQPWEVMASWLNPDELKGYMKGTVCAYLCREADKGGREDIAKALHTMQLYMDLSK